MAGRRARGLKSYSKQETLSTLKEDFEDFEFSTSVFGQLTSELQKILKVGDSPGIAGRM